MSGPRVLYSFPHRLGAPGIGNTAHRQVLALHELGCRITVCSASSAVELPGGVRIVETLAVPTPRGTARVPQRMLGVDRSYAIHDRRVARRLTRSPGHYDVVHVWPLGGLETLRAAARLGLPGLREVPNTHTAHAFAQVARELALLGLSAPPGHSHTLSPSRLQRERAEYNAAGGLLVPSRAVADTFLARGFGEDRLYRHRYGYDPAVFQPRQRSRGAPFTAVFAGRCEPRKGLHYALRAWHDSGAARNGRLVLCGAFDREYRALLADLLDDPSIVVREFCDDMASVMSAADVLLLPSVEEGSALVTYEAMGAGCVPLVSSAAGAPVRHGHDALVHEPRDTDGLTRDLARVTADPDLLARLRSAAIGSAASLRWIDSGRRLVDLYARCAESSRTAGMAPAASGREGEMS